MLPLIKKDCVVAAAIKLVVHNGETVDLSLCTSLHDNSSTTQEEAVDNNKMLGINRDDAVVIEIARNDTVLRVTRRIHIDTDATMRRVQIPA